MHLYTIHKYKLEGIHLTLHSKFVHKYQIFFELQHIVLIELLTQFRVILINDREY